MIVEEKILRKGLSRSQFYKGVKGFTVLQTIQSGELNTTEHRYEHYRIDLFKVIFGMRLLVSRTYHIWTLIQVPGMSMFWSQGIPPATDRVYGPAFWRYIAI
jgi:hypothetical protein